MNLPAASTSDVSFYTSTGVTTLQAGDEILAVECPTATYVMLRRDAAALFVRVDKRCYSAERIGPTAPRKAIMDFASRLSPKAAGLRLRLRPRSPTVCRGVFFAP